MHMGQSCVSPPAMRSGYEAHCAACMLKDDVGWLPLGQALSLDLKAGKPHTEAQVSIVLVTLALGRQLLAEHAAR